MAVCSPSEEALRERRDEANLDEEPNDGFTNGNSCQTVTETHTPGKEATAMKPDV